MSYFNGSIRNLSYRLRKFKDFLDDGLRDEILANEHIICDMIADQMYSGYDGRGKKIEPEYTPFTVSIKRQKGQPTDRVTLRDTGDFHSSLRVEFDEGGFYVTSDDSKAAELLEKYGTNIFRLSNQNLTILIREYIRPVFAEKLKELLQK
uniref:Uncharacterized protein n=1 Tax=Myoviridae sp. ctlRg1 TaxID=2826692 RepID=A0A8S5M6P1_9CAUD|nr:MAG TPA: hypothetical protein [Myoviridae sp. ctlRg1]